MRNRRFPRTIHDAEPAVAEIPEPERNHLEALIGGIVESHNLWCEEVSVAGGAGAQILTVVIDRSEGTEGISLDDLSEVSREISEAMDAQGDDIPGLGTAAYQLEISTPGTDRPLVRPYQWKRNLGRLVHTGVGELQPDGTFATKEEFTARIDAVNETGVELIQIKPGAKKGMPSKELPAKHYNFEVLSNAQVQVELKSEK